MAENFPKPHNKIEPIEEVQPRRPVDKVEESESLNPTEKVKFDQALEKANPAQADVQLRNIRLEDEAAKAPKKPSILDIAKEGRAIQATQAPSTDTLLKSATQLKESFKTPNAQLISFQEKRVAIPSEFVKEMSPHIEHIDQALIDTKKISSGIEVGSSIPTAETSPTARFLHFLTDADRRLDTIVGDINTYTSGGKKLSPEKLMAVQIKLNYVQQEMEFFTNIMNRAIESVKTLMNVQI